MPPLQLVDPESGYQNEVPDIWLTDGNPWEVKRNDIRFKVGVSRGGGGWMGEVAQGDAGRGWCHQVAHH